MAENEVDNEAIDRVARALYAQALSKVKQKTEAIQIPVDQIEKVLSEVISTSDRSAAILLFALIDDIFIFYYKQYLNNQIKGGVSSMTDGFGMLSTANSRITLAAALYWIDKPTYNWLNVLRKIRNHFAHETAVSSFSDDPIKGLIHSLPKFEDDIIKNIGAIPDHIDDRKAFLVRSSIAVAHLVLDLTMMKHSLEHKVNPRAIGWAGMPDKIKNVYDIAGRVAIEVLDLKE